MDSQALIQYIQQYVDITSDDITMIQSTFRVKRYLKGQYVAQSGDVCKYLSFVLSGCLKTSFITFDGKEHVVMLAIEDWWVGDLGSFTEQTPADFDIQCIDTTYLAQVSRDQLEGLFQQIPKLERFFRIIILRALIFAQKRVIANNSLTAAERYAQFRERYPQIEQRVPQYLIASYLGITKEFLSKIRST